MADKFSAQVDAWVKKTDNRIEMVFKESSQRVIEAMQKPVAQGGNMPIIDGYLRASLKVEINRLTNTTSAPPDTTSTFTFNLSGATSAIGGAALGDTIYATYGAIYAARVNYGFEGADKLGRVYNQKGRQFVGLAAQQWQGIVKSVSREAQLRFR